MSYIGNKPATAFETVQKQISTSNSGTTITLDRAVTSVQDILLTIDAVVQSYDNYSVSGTTLTVGGTLNNNRVEILYVGRTMQSVDPTDDSVSAAKIKTDAVTTAKVQNDAITVDKLNLISTSSVPSLEAKGDGSSQDGYIQLNCSQNSHGVKLKSPPHSANQSYTLTLPSTAPATDKMLQTNSSGVLSFVDAPSGTHVLLDDTYISSSTGNVTYTSSLITDTYEQYIITGSAIQMANNTTGNIRMYLSDDNGSSYFGGTSYARGIHVVQSGNSNNTLINRTGDKDAIYLTGNDYDYGGGTAYGNAGFVIRCLNLRNLATGSSARRLFLMNSVYLDRASGNYVQDEGMYYFKGGTGSINNITIQTTDSNPFAEGEFRLYGVK
jgi:hypothetical protein